MKLFATALALGLLMLPALVAADAPRPAGALAITTLEGKALDIKDLAGKPVLVLFFSTDCSHCQAAARILAPIYEEYRAKGFEFMGVALNPTAGDNLETFVKQYAVQFPVGLGGREEFVGFSGVTGRFYYPYLFFVDAKGQVSEEHQGSDQAYFADPDGSIRKSLDRLRGGS